MLTTPARFEHYLAAKTVVSHMVDKYMTCSLEFLVELFHKASWGILVQLAPCKPHSQHRCHF